MSEDRTGTPPGPNTVPGGPAELRMELAAETVRVFKRLRRTLVRATRTTRTRDVEVREQLARDQVVVERVPVGRVVEDVPPVRQEGEVTVFPVVEEELVLVRRLVLKEEVRLRRVRSTEPFAEVVTLREQQVSVTRTGVDEEAPPHPAGAQAAGSRSTPPSTRKDPS